MPAHLIAEEGPQKGLIIDLEKKDAWIIGRDPDESDFVLEDSTVSRRHVRLTKSAEGILIENLSRVNPTLVNDEKPSKNTLLKEGDRVQIGHTVFLFSEEAISNEKRKSSTKYDDIFGDIDTEKSPEPFREPPPPSRKSKEETSGYDTIFEDTGEEAPEPLHFLSVTPLMIKVISGPNAGAEIGIEKGRSYTIGKDSNTCDIVFQDLSVSRNHARLTILENGTIEIEDLGSKNGTAVNGVPITEKKSITTQDLIALGTTVFLVIDREAPQETIYSPMLPSSYEPTKEEEEEEETAPVEPKLEKKDWKKEPIPTKHLVAAAGFVITSFIIFLSFFSLFKPKGHEIAHKEPVNLIQEALAKYEGVQFTYNPGSGKLFLVGHVLTGVEEQELEYKLSEIEYITSLENNIVIDELVWKSMNDVLYENTPWKGVSIHSPKPGKFNINGFVQTSDEYAALADYLSINFPYVDRLENRVIIAETLTAQLQSLLLAHGFGAITFQTANGEVILSGRYSEKMESEYRKLLKQLHSIQGIANVKNFAMPTTPNQAAIDITQQFQVAGAAEHDGRGFNVVLNGKIYSIGDDVQGMKITSIEKNMILLEKDGMKYKIDYAR